MPQIAFCGYQFEGRIVKPGAWLTIGDLDLSPHQKGIVVLECAGNHGGKAWGHKRVDQLYLIWKYDFETQLWVEMGRALAMAWEWSLDLGPIARRALKEVLADAEADVLPSLPEVSARISAAIERELNPLEPEDQMHVLSIVHDQLASRFVRLPSAGEGLLSA